MFIITIILIVILSLLPVRDALAGYIMKGRKYISGALYLACILSFFFLLNPQGMRDT
ncbi:MAG: hypothetical protein H6767_08060 [Candidatus Peribacteria bacterium]|nr:MAG: hypothetical protein H6767_08060 [Candidatus Peribacteria bacterium]